MTVNGALYLAFAVIIAVVGTLHVLGQPEPAPVAITAER